MYQNDEQQDGYVIGGEPIPSPEVSQQRVTPEKIAELQTNEVMVFGSNTRGRHGSGAAKDALAFGAVEGRGEGLAGQTYAIPTRTFINGRLTTLEPIQIYCAVRRFCSYASAHPKITFLLTPIGTGRAGLKPCQIAPYFRHATPNVIMPASFLPYLTDDAPSYPTP